MYDDEDEIEEEDNDVDFSMDSSSKPVLQVKFNNSITPPSREDPDINEYDEEASSYQDDEDDINNYASTDIPAANRPASKYPMIDSNNRNYLDFSSTTPLPFAASQFFRLLLSQPAILVGM